MFIAGLQVPEIPFIDVVGRGGIEAPKQIGDMGVKNGISVAITIKFIVTKLSHPFEEAIKVAICVPAALKVKEFIENGKLLWQIVVSTETLKISSCGSTVKDVAADAQAPILLVTV